MSVLACHTVWPSFLRAPPFGGDGDEVPSCAHTVVALFALSTFVLPSACREA